MNEYKIRRRRDRAIIDEVLWTSFRVADQQGQPSGPVTFEGSPTRSEEAISVSLPSTDDLVRLKEVSCSKMKSEEGLSPVLTRVTRPRAPGKAGGDTSCLSAWLVKKSF